MKIAFGGPPNSGKSTITAAVVKLVRQRKDEHGYNPTFTWQSLDVTDTSLPAMLGDEDDHRDVEWTTERAEERRAMFGGRDERLVVADCPGLIDEKTEIVTQPADGLVLVVSRERSEAVEEWREFADRIDAEVFAELTTVLEDGDPQWIDRDERRAVVRSVHNAEFDANGVAAYDDATTRVFKQLVIDLLRAAEGR